MIRVTFQNKKETYIFFKSTLPPQLLDLENLEFPKSSFTSEKLEQTDPLFQILPKSKNKTNVYFTF
ncbi:Rpn family recombination-promoting nuclease/putative transposase [Leptospira interrogans]|uniref:Transposase, YhgA-like domain protein n=1 Tax=Leptospira interrogans str. FPW1039 TaxID=1193040 RepID=A0A0F6IL76_LEPIR|nr:MULTISPECIES: Rpn family recombination-promoting nuclease/putative transposase [Leptospira]ASV07145.1 transposase [Leptospira interrogans serovar Canicola]ASV08379.1 transposase [Leptospira interrogans serovar Canicola]EJO78266.1 transposase, YhgA-like domain protein [Leptospira interrogans serovar Pomona str. Kennewicki LC82-25]EKN96772.1 transposase, YhgA-like domain protein [Leptospira interrogans serovar Pomona str. Pomona]EKO71660.1 transposase, YhgA-like domain protein [Leptospira int